MIVLLFWIVRWFVCLLFLLSFRLIKSAPAHNLILLHLSFVRVNCFGIFFPCFFFLKVRIFQFKAKRMWGKKWKLQILLNDAWVAGQKRSWSTAKQLWQLNWCWHIALRPIRNGRKDGRFGRNISPIEIPPRATSICWLCGARQSGPIQ